MSVDSESQVVSILGPGSPELVEPDFFGDLQLDRIVAAATRGRGEYELEDLYRRPLATIDEVVYRQAAYADLLAAPVREPVERFAERMRTMRSQRSLVRELHHALQRRRWFLQAVRTYVDATRELAGALRGAGARSEAFASVAGYLDALVGSDGFTRLADEARAIADELAGLHYTVNLKGARVHVDAYREQDDLSAAVRATFARFEQDATEDYRQRFTAHAELNHVEQQVLDRVARLFPEPFARLARFTADHAEPFDAVVLRFDREVQFYLGYLAATEPVSRAGGRFAMPTMVDARDDVGARDAFDLALAITRAAGGGLPVANDFSLRRPERVLVVTGPNQGGKTTFARSLGQLHHLASLGLPVPARSATLMLPDAIFTHFEREETLDSLRGKFEDELVRLREILAASSERSLLVMNESFGSTTVADGRLVGSEILRRVIDAGSIAVFVTFIDELAALGPETVSMMSTVSPDDPAQRTFRIERKPADGLAYAGALAAKHRLRGEDVRRRMAR